MTTPENREPYAHIFAQVDEILRRPKKKTVVLFSFPEFKERWESQSVARQYYHKMLMAIFGGSALFGILYLVAPQNNLSIAPAVIGWGLGIHFSRKVRESVGNDRNS